MQIIRKIGFIGIGNMGAPMAGQLAGKGYAVTAYDSRKPVVDAWLGQHAGTGAASLAALAAAADAVIFMVPDDKVVKAILFDEGLAGHLAAGTVVLDMSSSDPEGTVEIGRRLAARGIEYVDAPVMGGVPFAKDGTLDIMAGGNPTTIERCRAVLEAMGRKVYCCGPLGSGHVMKALANCINACALANTLEAMVIGRKFGLDTAVMAEAVDAMCNGRQHPIVKKVVPQVLTRRYGTGMAMRFIAKDVQIASRVARRMGVDAPVADQVAEIWNAASRQLGGDRDQTEIVHYWEDQAGTKL
jgi:3-hydroxyisobutyrate dehydrogenase